MAETSDAVMACQRLAQKLLPESAGIAARVTEQILIAIPELFPPNYPEALQDIRESTEQNVGATLAMLAFGVTPPAVEPPAGTLRALRRLAAASVDLTTALKAYRHAHAYVWDAWAGYVHSQHLDPEHLAGVLTYSSRVMFSFWDGAAEQYTARLRREFPGLSGGFSRQSLLEDILAGATVDLGLIRRELGYDLSGQHVAMVLAPLHDVSEATAAADAIRNFDAKLPVLVQPQGDGLLWVWIASRQPLDHDTLSALEALPLHDVVVGMGEPDRGVDGFQRSHVQAEQALRVARLRATPTARTVRYRNVEQLTLLTAHPSRAREFAYARLGALTERTEAMARNRSTLRSYLNCGCNKARVAQDLGVHQKTVAYRLSAAEEILGHPIEAAVTDLGAALLIDLAFHGE